MEKHTAVVKKVVQTGRDITTIYFTVPRLTYLAGQYITVFFDGGSRPEGKAYSLSSAPHQPLLSITVKRVGEYSGRLCDLHVGDTFLCSPAYGDFNPKSSQPLVCIAAGVGIAPIWSVIKSELQSTPSRQVSLHYSATHSHTMPHRPAITQTIGANAQLYITRQGNLPFVAHTTRIRPADCVQPGAMYLLCGSVSFVRDMWQGLVACGARPEDISTEVFFE